MDFVFGDMSRLPIPKERLEPFACKSPLGFVEEEQIVLAQCPEFGTVPYAARSEIPDEVRCGVRLERNLDRRIEEFGDLFEVRRSALNVEKTEVSQFTE